MALDLIWHLYGELLLAGALGGVVRWAVNREPWQQGLVGIVVGAIVAYYLQPIAGQWLRPAVDFSQIDPAAARGCGAFLLGLAGIWPIQWFLDWARRRFEIKIGAPALVRPNDDKGAER